MKNGNGHCKSCGLEIETGEVRCVKHEREFKRWLAEADAERQQKGYYRPRFDGLKSEANVDLRFRQSARRLAPPALRPEQPLKFD